MIVTSDIDDSLVTASNAVGSASFIAWLLTERGMWRGLVLTLTRREAIESRMRTASDYKL